MAGYLIEVISAPLRVVAQAVRGPQEHDEDRKTDGGEEQELASATINHRNVVGSGELRSVGCRPGWL